MIFKLTSQNKAMFKNNKTFSSFSINDLQKAKDFYGTTLGLNVTDGEMPGILTMKLTNNEVTLYTKPNHEPATFTVLNFIVDNINDVVNELNSKGVQMEHYDMENLKTNEKGIVSGYGPDVAWFKDPAGNILSIMEIK